MVFTPSNAITMTDFIASALTYGTAAIIGVASAVMYNFIHKAKVEQKQNALEIDIQNGHYQILELAAENTRLKEKLAELEQQIPKSNLRVSAKQTA